MKFPPSSLHRFSQTNVSWSFSNKLGWKLFKSCKNNPSHIVMQKCTAVQDAGCYLEDLEEGGDAPLFTSPAPWAASPAPGSATCRAPAKSPSPDRRSASGISHVPRTGHAPGAFSCPRRSPEPESHVVSGREETTANQHKEGNLFHQKRGGQKLLRNHRRNTVIFIECYQMCTIIMDPREFCPSLCAGCIMPSREPVHFIEIHEIILLIWSQSVKTTVWLFFLDQESARYFYSSTFLHNVNK